MLFCFTNLNTIIVVAINLAIIKLNLKPYDKWLCMYLLFIILLRKNHSLMIKELILGFEKGNCNIYQLQCLTFTDLLASFVRYTMVYNLHTKVPKGIK